MMKLHKSAVSAHLLSPRCSSATRSVARATPAPAPVDTVPIRIGTRGSPLAQHQAQQVAALLRRVRPEWGEHMFSLTAIQTHGDLHGAQQLRALGAGAFTELIDAAVAAGDVDLGVHSLKDAPVQLPPGVQLAACLPRDDPRDAFISLKAASLAELPPGARVGTGSLRRKAQILHAHPHLNVVPVRGNVESRLQLLQSGQLDAIVLAVAGLARLGQAHAITRVLEFDEMLPAACQGAIGITCAADDSFLRWELSLVCHEPTQLEVAAERALLAALLAPPAEPEQQQEQEQQQEPEQAGEAARKGGSAAAAATAATGSSSITGLPMLPPFAVAAHAGFDAHDCELRLEGLVASEDGSLLHRVSVSRGAGSPGEAAEVGTEVGRQLRAYVLQQGWLAE